MLIHTMKNTIILILISSVLSSCATYLDKESSINDSYELYSNNDHNIYKNKNPIKESYDTDIYKKNKFQVRLPKNIVNWQSGSYDVFEYSSKQVLLIKAGNDKEKVSKEWEFRNPTEEEVLNYLDDYWTKRGYATKYLENLNPNRVSKIYSNAISTVLLYNIKEENFDTYENLIKTFKYIN